MFVCLLVAFLLGDCDFISVSDFFFRFFRSGRVQNRVVQFAIHRYSSLYRSLAALLSPKFLHLEEVAVRLYVERIVIPPNTVKCQLKLSVERKPLF